TVTASVQGTVSVTGEGYTTIRDSTTARQLFNFCTMYRRDNDEVIQGVRSNFTELGIPSDYLSP
ncbi:hypothetical protein, partial [Micrococcus luteus]|uniref:hypothetical protein n=1 Tax=Micrococcus luteus TaxID=1270 RepID=UPI00254ED5B4